MDAIPELFERAVLTLDRFKARELIQQYQQDHGTNAAIEDIVVPFLYHVGNGWEHGDYALSQVYMSGRICEELVEFLLPPSSQDQHHSPRIAITVLEDYHLLGKRIVASTILSHGYFLLDYNRVTVEELVTKTIADRIDILLISTLMLSSAMKVRNIREALNARGRNPKIIVGGAPFRFDHELWKRVQADAMCQHAADVIPLLNAWKEV